MQDEGADCSVAVGSKGSRFLERGGADLIRAQKHMISAFLTRKIEGGRERG